MTPGLSIPPVPKKYGRGSTGYIALIAEGPGCAGWDGAVGSAGASPLSQVVASSLGPFLPVKDSPKTAGKEYLVVKNKVIPATMATNITVAVRP